MKRNNYSDNMGGIVALVIGIFLCMGMGFVAGVNTCGKMIWALLKSARRFVTGYLTGTDEDRSSLALSLKSTVKTAAIALVIVLVSGFCVNILFDNVVRAIFSFVPNFLLDAIGFLALGVGVRTVVGISEKLGVRQDVTQKARKMVEFGMSALMPVALYRFVRYATPEGISLILACGIASWAYRQVNAYRAQKAAAAAN